MLFHKAIVDLKKVPFRKFTAFASAIFASLVCYNSSAIAEHPAYYLELWKKDRELYDAIITDCFISGRQWKDNQISTCNNIVRSIRAICFLADTDPVKYKDSQCDDHKLSLLRGEGKWTVYGSEPGP